MVRINGQLIPSGFDTELGPDDTKALIYSILTDDQKAKFEEEHELDFSIGIPGRLPLPGECVHAARLRLRRVPDHRREHSVLRGAGPERNHSAARHAAARAGAA